MKRRIIPIITLFTMLAGCGGVSQEDYDALQRKYEKLEAKYEDLKEENEELRTAASQGAKPQAVINTQDEAPTSRFFTVDSLDNTYENSDTGEIVLYSLYTDGQQNPNCTIIYSIPYKEGADTAYYELKATWLLTEMDGFFSEKQFENYNISVSTPQGIDRDLTSSKILNRDFGISGKNRDGKDTDDPDWFIDACVDIFNNGYEDEWLINTIEDMKSEIDSGIHYH